MERSDSKDLKEFRDGSSSGLFPPRFGLVLSFELLVRRLWEDGAFFSFRACIWVSFSPRGGGGFAREERGEE